MKLELLDIDFFIKKNKLKQVKTIRLYEKVGKTEPTGLFSEEIFGRFGSSERRKTFAYIDLKVKIVHPEAYLVLLGLDASISKLITNKVKYFIDKDGTLVESEDGKSGIDFFVRNFNKINFDNFKKTKPKVVEFINQNKKTIIVDNFLVLPAGIRDITLSRTSGKTMVNFSDLSELYTALVRQTNALGDNLDNLPDELRESLAETIQRSCLEINDWIKNRMKGKTGLISGGLLHKTTDYSGRLVITTDNTLKLGTIGLPYQAVLKLYEPFAINYILKKDSTALGLIQSVIKSEKEVDMNDLKRLIQLLISNPKIIPSELEDYLYFVAKEISKDKIVTYKRDPVDDRDHWLAADIRVDRNGMTMMLNPLDLPRLGGDHDGDRVY